MTRLELGARFGDLTVAGYEDEGRIAASPFDDCYRARDKDGREVRLRTWSLPEALDDPDASAESERFLRRAASVARLDHHPHVLRVYEFGRIQRRLWLTSQRVGADANEDPGWWLRPRASLGRREVLDILRAIGSALDHLHANDFVLGFFSPLQIHASAAGTFIDLGWMQWIGDGASLDEWKRSSAERILGNPTYSPVEACPRDGLIGPRSDVYILGLLAFEALAGYSPHLPTDPTPIATWANKLAGRLVRVPDGLPQPSLHVLTKCLAPDPEQRWPSASAFVAALEACLR